MKKFLVSLLCVALIMGFVPGVCQTANAATTESKDVIIKDKDIYMNGYPTVIEKKADGGEYDLTITYVKDGETKSFDYTLGKPAVIYGGVKDVEADLEETSLTLKSGVVTALIGGSKSQAATGSVKKAIINIEGGEVITNTNGSSPNGVVTAVWYWGPDVEEFEFNMSGGYVNKVYGGSTTSTAASNSEITVSKFTANVSGGEITTFYAGASSETGSSGKVQTVKNADVNISGTVKIETLLGGGFSNWNGSKSVVENVTITVDGGEIGIIYAGGQNGTDTASNNSAISEVKEATVTINGGTVGRVAGGGINRHWLNRYWVTDDGTVVKMNYNNTAEANYIHYSNVENVTLNINSDVDEVWLGGNSWAHVENATANINANIKEVSCIGNYGYVENATINVKENAEVEQVDMLRSGIVGNIEINNEGTIEILTAGAPEKSYKNNQGVNVVAALGSVVVKNEGTVGEAQLTYGLEKANEVTMTGVNLIVASVDPLDSGSFTNTPEKGVFTIKDGAIWTVDEITVPNGTTLNVSKNSISKGTVLTLEAGAIVSGLEGFEDGEVSALLEGSYKTTAVNTLDINTKHIHESVTKSDEDYHWDECKECGVIMVAKEAHDPVEKSDDDNHWTECADCGKVLSSGKHNIVDGACTDCEYTKEIDEEPTEEDKDIVIPSDKNEISVPKTDDYSNMLPWMIAMLFAGLTAIVAMKKKEEQ